MSELGDVGKDQKVYNPDVGAGRSKPADEVRVWVNGEQVSASAPSIAALDHGVTVGDGVFETCKVVDGVPFALTRHARRLDRSIAGLGLIHPLLVRARDEGLRPRPRDPCRTGWLERDDTAHLRPVTR